MSYLDSYKERVSIGRNGINNAKSRLVYEARKNFEKSLLKDPCSIYTRITDVGAVNISEDTKLVHCIINDISRNDQKSFDEKTLYVKHDENVGIGSYVEFDNFIWLVVFKEHRSADIYKSFTIRKCNQILKYNYQGNIYEIPCVIKNLTQYSDGLQDIVYTSAPDARRSITYSNNPITSKIELGHRFMVGHERTYRVTHIQNFEYSDRYELESGITTCIAVHTAVTSNDDTDNNLAFNEGSNMDESNDVLMIGSSLSYNLDVDVYNWEVEYISDNSDYINILANNGDCSISIGMDFDLVGEIFKLRALSLDNEVILEKSITVIGFI